VLDGTWKTGNVWGGVKERMIRIEGFGPKVPQAVRDEALARQRDIAAGKVKPFAGPIVDNDGKQVIAAGQSLADEQILNMNYLVQGVQGKIGK
jgi:simple sugar transport system substrate-binding protein